MITCKNCGATCEENVTYCAQCGADLTAQSTANSTPVEETSSYVYNEPANEPEKGKGLAIASLVCGIVSFLCFPAITGALGIIFGAVAKNQGCKSGMATAGIVCGAIGVVLWIIMLIASVSLTSLFGLNML